MNLTDKELINVCGGRAMYFIPVYGLFQRASNLVFKLIRSFFK